jgi:hypothetical protein
MLSDSHRNDGVLLPGKPPQRANRVLLQNSGVRFVVLERLLFLPLEAFFDPAGNILRRLDDPIQLIERVFHIAADGDVRRLVLVELGSVDVNVDDLAMLAELLHFSRHAIVEPHAQGDQEVGLVHGVVGVHRTMHAEHV